MKKPFAQYLRHPISLKKFKLTISKQNKKGEIISGKLITSAGEKVPIINGVPRFINRPFLKDQKTKQTASSFAEKWKHGKNKILGHNTATFNNLKKQILATLGCDTLLSLKKIFKGQKIILNAGCGVGWTEDLFNFDKNTKYFAVDISHSVDIAFNRNKNKNNVCVIQADLFALPFPYQFFDIIYSIGVIHHTPNPQKAFITLTQFLKKGGIIGIYVYNIKPFLREVTDKTIRQITTNMTHDQCFSFSQQLSLLGKAFQQFKKKLIIQKNIPLLKIKRGAYDLQQFIYDYLLKCYYNQKEGLELSALVNVDWYHPKYASHHSLETVLSWFKKANIKKIKIKQPKGWKHSGYFISGIKDS